MNTILIALSLLPLQAGKPNPPSGATNQPRVGKVLLLENERTIEGEVERFQDYYRVRRSVGETQIPTHQVLALCADNKEAFEYLKRRTNLQDADERFKLAQWAQTRGLLNEALEESQAAIDLRPNHEPTKRLRLVIEQMDKREREKKLFPEKPGLASQGVEGIAPLPFEVSTESLGIFCQKIQPLLMNSCASCHATGKGGNFKLSRVYSGSATNKRMLQNNLAAVLNQVNPHQIGASPILVKSVSVHGDLNQAPLHNRSTPAFRMLEEWIRFTVGNTQLDPGALSPIPTTLSTNQAPMVPPIPMGSTGIVPVSNKTAGFASSPPPSSAEKAQSEKPATAEAAEGEKTSTEKTDKNGKPTGPKPVVDPYDPEEFNKGSAPPPKKTPPTP